MDDRLEKVRSYLTSTKKRIRDEEMGDWLSLLKVGRKMVMYREDEAIRLVIRAFDKQDYSWAREYLKREFCSLNKKIDAAIDIMKEAGARPNLRKELRNLRKQLREVEAVVTLLTIH